MEQCSKEKEINQLRSAMFGVNGKDGMINDVREMKTDIKCLLMFQTQTETRTEQDMKHQAQIKEMKKHNAIERRWLVGLAITAILALISQLVI